MIACRSSVPLAGVCNSSVCVAPPAAVSSGWSSTARLALVVTGVGAGVERPTGEAEFDGVDSRLEWSSVQLVRATRQKVVTVISMTDLIKASRVAITYHGTGFCQARK